MTNSISQSLSGGASYNGVPIVIPGTGSTSGLQYGMFFKYPFNLSSVANMVLMQMNVPGGGYIYSAIQTDNSFITGIAAAGNGGNWSASHASNSSSLFLSMNYWYYVTVAFGIASGNMVFRTYIYQNGIGWWASPVTSAGAAVASDTNMSVVFGLGQTVGSPAFSSYWNFINLSGNEISKFWLRNANSGAPAFGPGQLNLPNSDADIAALNPLIYYNCRQPVSTAPASLLDVSGNAYHGVPGPWGLQILQDGPFAV